MTALLPTLAVPALVIVGEDDELTKPQEMQAIAEEIPQSEFVSVANAGHMAPLEQPAIVNEAIIRYLDSLPKAGQVED